ncbi:MAG: leucine-rich repeat domain-containing protein, partial [Bacteroidales bacterium]|nr:leucine-rich repeat domain-containing protein [Bacteroidales bacterium]
GAFMDCHSLTSVTIPNSVTSIGEWAFEGCISLTSVNIGNSVTSLNYGVFDSCINLTSVTIPNSVISIGKQAFNDCYSLTSVTIGNSVTYIGKWAFEDCYSLTSVTIPNSVTSIGEQAFRYCTSLESINLSDNITSIGRNCFDSCINLTNGNIPTSLSVIDTSVFRYCTSLTSVTIPNNINSIRGWAFMGCKNLSDVTIGNNVSSIGYAAFAYCDSLTTVTSFANNPPALGEFAFYDIGSPSTLYPPYGYSYFYKNSDWKDWFDCIVMDTTIYATIAQGETYLLNGQELSQSDVYTANVLSEAGCEINLTLVLDVIASDNIGADYSSLSQTSLESLSLKPNPTKGLIEFGQRIDKVVVIDISGRRIESFFDANQINISHLPAGVYHLELQCGDETVVRKIVKE